MDHFTLYQKRQIVAILLLYVKYSAVRIIAPIPKVRDDYIPKMPYLTVLGYCKVLVGLSTYLTI